MKRDFTKIAKSTLAVIALFFSVLAIADSWAPARPRAVASNNGEIVVRIIPGESMGDVFGFAGSPKGKFAFAHWFRFRNNRYEFYQTTQLINPIAPLFVAVADDGATITLDNWHNVGFGDVVAIYGSDGKLRKKWQLNELYPKSTIEKMKRSVSSIWWRCENHEPFLERNGILDVDDTLGGRLTFRLSNASFTYKPGEGACRS